MTFTTTQLSALETAIGTGELSVKYDGKEIVYRNMSDLIMARDFIKSALIADGILTAATLSNRGAASVAVFGRG